MQGSALHSQKKNTLYLKIISYYLVITRSGSRNYELVVNTKYVSDANHFIQQEQLSIVICP